MPREANVFDDHYQKFDNYLELLEDYDEEMGEYYDLRDANRRVDSFTLQVVKRLQNPTPVRQQLFQQIAAQGFKLSMD